MCKADQVTTTFAFLRPLGYDSNLEPVWLQTSISCGWSSCNYFWQVQLKFIWKFVSYFVNRQAHKQKAKTLINRLCYHISWILIYCTFFNFQIKKILYSLLHTVPLNIIDFIFPQTQITNFQNDHPSKKNLWFYFFINKQRRGNKSLQAVLCLCSNRDWNTVEQNCNVALNYSHWKLVWLPSYLSLSPRERGGGRPSRQAPGSAGSKQEHTSGRETVNSI